MSRKKYTKAGLPAYQQLANLIDVLSENFEEDDHLDFLDSDKMDELRRKLTVRAMLAESDHKRNNPEDWPILDESEPLNLPLEHTDFPVTTKTKKPN